MRVFRNLPLFAALLAVTACGAGPNDLLAPEKTRTDLAIGEDGLSASTSVTLDSETTDPSAGDEMDGPASGGSGMSGSGN